MPLKRFYNAHAIEAGCDEAGRGCLAGPVFSAAVILSKDFKHELLNDSKLLKESERVLLRGIIEKEALAWAVERVEVRLIDKFNILQASIYGMHRALDKLSVRPELILVDGNYFNPYNFISHQCIVKGDSKYNSIAAASILAKTHRDAYMKKLHRYYPEFKWSENKGYPTLYHRKTVLQKGKTKHHRKTFRIKMTDEIVAK